MHTDFCLQHFPLYGPDYELHISPGNRPDENNQEYINDVRKTISGELGKILGITISCT